ncbi:hypothetical protein [Nocardia sp. NPDC019255]|uniref:hypothetical protein n=1 Tax=unclassified Nocardia TaxID=2637762 RepID=UPI0033CB60BA
MAPQAPLCSGNGAQQPDRDLGVTASAAAVTSGGDEQESGLDIGQRLPRRRGQFAVDLVSGRVSRVGGFTCAVELGFEFGQLLQAEAALLLECGAQHG